MKDDLGDRMKNFYENRSRFFLSRRTYVLIRIDGKAFHTYTKGLLRPFDQGLIDDMNETAKKLCTQIQGARFAYVQSDEISILVTDFDDINDNTQTEAWFDNNLQKMCSVSASLATSNFNNLRCKRFKDFEFKQANFDSRVWEIPKRSEVINYFIQRQQDATRNSISSVAQAAFSHKELNGKSSNEMQEMLWQSFKINWNDFEPQLKRGRGIIKGIKEVKIQPNIAAIASEAVKATWKVKEPTSIDTVLTEEKIEYYVDRPVWQAIDVPIFTKEKAFFDKIVPANY